MADLFLGYRTAENPMGGWIDGERVVLDSDALTQHAFICGQIGFGKTVFAKGLVEEAILAGIPVIAVDFKGDISSLAITGDWASRAALDAVFGDEAASVEAEYRGGLDKNNRAVRARMSKYLSRVHPRLFSPNSSVAERVALAALPSFASLPADDLESEARDDLIEVLVRAFARSMYGSDAKLKNNENAVKLLEELVRWCAREGRTLDGLEGIHAVRRLVENPPFASIGGMAIDEYLPPKERQQLLRLLAGRTIGNERRRYEGTPLSVESLLDAPEGKTPLSVVYMGHISDFMEQSMVLAQLCADIYRWMRLQGGSRGLRLLLYVDEVGGGENRNAFYPSYPYNPPSKAPLALLVKQGRSAGVGCLLATQNPMSVDVRGLGNVATWGVGKLTQKNDLQRIVAALDSLQMAPERAARMLSSLPKGIFLSVSGGLKGPEWIRERWLYSVHRQLSPKQVAALHNYMKSNDLYSGQAVPEESSIASNREVSSVPPVPLNRFAREPRHDSDGDDDETLDLAEADATDTLDLSPAATQVSWVVRWSGGQQSLKEGQTVTVGRSSKATVRLDDKAISRLHVELQAEGQQLVVRDLQGKNPAQLEGIVLDGVVRISVDEAPCELTLGKSRMVLDVEGL